MNNFDVSLRLLGNEVVAFKISGESELKNWFVIGAASFMLVLYTLSATLPTLVALVK